NPLQRMAQSVTKESGGTTLKRRQPGDRWLLITLEPRRQFRQWIDRDWQVAAGDQEPLEWIGCDERIAAQAPLFLCAIQEKNPGQVRQATKSRGCIKARQRVNTRPKFPARSGLMADVRHACFARVGELFSALARQSLAGSAVQAEPGTRTWII